MKSPIFKIFIVLVAIYLIYLISGWIGTGKSPDPSPRRSRTAVERRQPESEMKYLRLNTPSDESLITAGGRDLFSFYQKPVIETQPERPVREPERPVTTRPQERPPVVRDPEPDLSKPDPRLANFEFIAYFSTIKGDMIILKEGEDEYSSHVGGIIKGDIEIIRVRNIGTGLDFVEINIIDSKRPSKKIYFNPITF